MVKTSASNPGLAAATETRREGRMDSFSIADLIDSAIESPEYALS